ncbi:MAG: MSCRAMM family protein, partial [Vicinamibacteria bacterium]
MTDLGGHFALKGLTEGSQALVIEHPDFARTTVELRGQGGGASEETVIVLGHGGRITGVVRSANGKPVAGAQVGALVFPDPTSAGDPAETDGEGHYSIEKLAPGGYMVMCMNAPGGEDDSDSVRGAKQAEVRDGETTIVNFGGEEKKILVSGTVRRQGKGVPGAVVSFAPGRIYMAILGGEMMGRTREDGRYEVHRDGPGPYIVTVRSEREETQRESTFEVAVPDVGSYERNITLGEGTISGTVTSEAGNKPVEGARVSAFRVPDAQTGASPPDAARRLLDRPSGAGGTEEAGSYRVEDLAPGTYRIVVAARGYAPFQIDGLVLKADGAVTADARLRAGRKLYIRVVDSDNRPVPRVPVGLLDAEGAPVNGGEMGSFTGADGTAAIED